MRRSVRRMMELTVLYSPPAQVQDFDAGRRTAADAAELAARTGSTVTMLVGALGEPTR